MVRLNWDGQWFWWHHTIIWCNWPDSYDEDTITILKWITMTLNRLFLAIRWSSFLATSSVGGHCCFPLPIHWQVGVEKNKNTTNLLKSFYTPGSNSLNTIQINNVFRIDCWGGIVEERGNKETLLIYDYPRHVLGTGTCPKIPGKERDDQTLLLNFGSVECPQHVLISRGMSSIPQVTSKLFLNHQNHPN